MAARKLKPADPEKPQNDQPAGDTSWKNGVPEAGWYKMPDAWWRDLPRLQRGLYQRMLIEYVWGTTVPRSKGAAMPEKSPWLSYVEMAAVFRCSPEQVRDDARDAAKRGLITLEQDARKGCRIGISWERWPNLKDYTAPRPVAVPEKPQTVAVPEVPEKPQKQVRWLSRAVAVEPGATFDLPKLDFAVERISLRNTSAEGTIKIGAGSCEGGVLVLETNAELVSKKTKQVSEPERESTPVKPKPKEAATDPIVQQIAEVVGSYGPVTIPAITRMIAASHATPEQVLHALSVVKPPESAENPVGWILSMVLRYFAGAYKPRAAVAEKRRSERDQRALNAMRGIYGSKKEDKIA